MNDVKPVSVLQMTRLYTDIALFRRGPEDVPVSTVLLLLTIGAYAFITLALSATLPAMPGNGIGLLALDTVFALGWYWVVMKLAGRPERFLQTVTALFGCQALLAPAAVAVSWLFVTYMNDPTMQVPAVLALFALGIWTLALNSRILRAATSWPTFTCIALVLGQVLIGRLVVLSIFPGEIAISGQ